MRRLEMIINEMELNKVLWCEQCGYTTLIPERANCPNCNIPMEEIGFVEDEVKTSTKDIGGSVKEGACRCGNPRASKGIDAQGRRRYRTQCYKCLYQARKIPKADNCKICGISPEKKSDLHLDHIDGNRSNNSNKNLQTLCVDCHKYKTNKQKDWKKKLND